MIKPFGMLLLILILRNIAFNKQACFKSSFVYLSSLLVFLELFVNVGYMFKFGDFELQYSEFVTALLFAYSARVVFGSEKIGIKYSMIMLSLSLIVTELLLILNPIGQAIYRNNTYVIPKFSLYSLQIFARVIVGLIISIGALNTLTRQDIANVSHRIVEYAKVTYVVCAVEMVVKNVFHSTMFNEVVGSIFGVGESTLDILMKRGSLYSLQGLLKEPSHLTFGLFMFLVILIYSDVPIKTKDRMFIFGLLLLVVSGSFAGFGYAISLVLMYFIVNERRLKPGSFVLLFFAMLIFIIPNSMTTYYLTRLTNSLRILDSFMAPDLVTSEQVRLNSIIETYRTVFLQRPFFGAGLGIPYAYGTNIMILSSIGIAGFGLWFWYYFISIGKCLTFKKIFTVSVIFFVFSFIGSISVLYSMFTIQLVLQLRQH